MRTLIITGFAVVAFSGASALAADMAIKAPPPAPAPTSSWTGFYVGGNIGYGWQDPTVTFTPNDSATQLLTCGAFFGSTCAPPASFNIKGVLGGLQGGYDWQFNRNGLLGIEADFDWTGLRGTGTSNFMLGAIPASLPANFQSTQKFDWFGTVRARLGFLPTDNILIYGTGGFAYARVDENIALNGQAGAGVNVGAIPNVFGYFCVTGPNCFLGSSSRTAIGWTAGAGVEYALSRNISVKAEYLYVDLGNGDAVTVVTQATNPPGLFRDSFVATYSRTDFQMVRGGVNYKF